MPLTIGVDITDIRRRTKDMNSKIESGVAGRNMAGELSLPQRDHVAERVVVLHLVYVAIVVVPIMGLVRVSRR